MYSLFTYKIVIKHKIFVFQYLHQFLQSRCVHAVLRIQSYYKLIYRDPKFVKCDILNLVIYNETVRICKIHKIKIR